MWPKPLLYRLLNPWLATLQKLPEKRAVHEILKAEEKSLPLASYLFSVVPPLNPPRLRRGDSRHHLNEMVLVKHQFVSLWRDHREDLEKRLTKIMMVLNLAKQILGFSQRITINSS